MAELFRRPRNEMVARFLRAENILHAAAAAAPDGQTLLRFADREIRIPGRHHGEVTFMIRPELLRLRPAGAAADNAVPARLTDISDRGAYQRLELDVGVPVVAFVPAGGDAAGPRAGGNCTVVFPPDAVHVLRS